MCVRDISEMFVIIQKKCFLSTLTAGILQSTDSLKASVFISSKVTGLIDGAGKSSQQLEVPPGRVKRDAGNVNSFLHLSFLLFLCDKIYIVLYGIGNDISTPIP